LDKSRHDSLVNSSRQRFGWGAVSALAAGFAGFTAWAGRSGFDFLPLTGVCGFKQQFGLPCPTCGMTTAFLEFFRGYPLKAFYIQPAGGLLCILLILFVLWTSVLAIWGKDIGFVRRVKLKYIILFLLAVFSGGWAVTVARTVAQWQ
jgi:hypothetical protein